PRPRRPSDPPATKVPGASEGAPRRCWREGARRFGSCRRPQRYTALVAPPATHLSRPRRGMWVRLALLAGALAAGSACATIQLDVHREASHAWGQPESSPLWQEWAAPLAAHPD